MKAVLAAAPVAMAIALGAAGCSDDARPSGPGNPIAAAVRDVQDASAADDIAGICERMTQTAQRQAAETAQADPTTCERDVARAFDAIAAGGGWSDSERPSVSVRERIGSEAVATIEHEDGWQAHARLAKDAGTWKLASFFGVPPPDRQLTEDTMRGLPFPATAAKPLRAFGAGRKLCPDLSDQFHPKVTGGCRLQVSGESISIRVLTPFGDLKLADCAVAYRVSVAPQAHTFTNRVVVAGDRQAACGDVEPCRTEDGEPRPWQGRFVDEGDGNYLHHMVACLRTPVGMFVGRLVMRLAPEGDGWRVEPANRGTVGVRLDGELAVTGEPFGLRESRF